MTLKKKPLENKDRFFPRALAQKGRIDYVGLRAALEEAVKKEIPGTEKFGVAFSGGIDSGVIAFLAGKISKNAVLLSVGLPTSTDLARVKPLAKKMKMKIVTRTLTEKEIMENYTLAKKILKMDDELQCTLGAVNVSIAQLAQREGLSVVLVGSGADELFCGYGVFDACRENEKACEKLRTEKVENVEEHDVKREKKCAKEFGIDVHAPFLEKKFAEMAMRIPAIENLRGKYGNVRKNTLRMLAERMNVPGEIVGAPKKAMQYGSGARKVIAKRK